MARFTRIQVALKMAETGLVPVFYHKDVEVAKQVVKACYEGGVRVFEFTNRGDFAHEIFGELNKWAAKECPKLMLGVGSIIDAGTASLYIQLGTSFIVAPLINEEVARTCNRRKILWAPGCGSLTEISKAEELGAEIVKVFPGSSVGGPGFVSAVKGPCPWTSIMPTGGVEPTEESLTKWFKAGVTCVGMGSNLCPASVIEAENWSAISEQCKQTLIIIKRIKQA